MEIEYRIFWGNFQFYSHFAENLLELKSALPYLKIKIKSFFFTDLLVNRIKATKTNCHGHFGSYKLGLLLLSALFIFQTFLQFLSNIFFLVKILFKKLQLQILLYNLFIPFHFHPIFSFFRKPRERIKKQFQRNRYITHLYDLYDLFIFKV